MENNRKVSWRILFSLLKSKRPFSIIGIIFPLIAIFVILPLVFLLSKGVKRPCESYDFDKISKQGVEKKAVVTDIKTLYNVTVNGEHPNIVMFKYDNDGVSKADETETMAYIDTARFNIGKEIKILTYQNQAIVKDLEPYSFPFFILYIIPAIFFVLGTIFLLVALIPSLKTYKLYKEGVVKDAYIVSMTSGNGGFKSRGGRAGFNQNILINYYFLDEFKNKVFGKSTTDDLMILNEKKSGDTIKVFVSEKDLTQSCLVPRLEAMKNNWEI